MNSDSHIFVALRDFAVASNFSGCVERRAISVSSENEVDGIDR